MLFVMQGKSLYRYGTYYVGGANVSKNAVYGISAEGEWKWGEQKPPSSL